MRLTRTILGFAAAASLTLTPAYADKGHSSSPKPTTIHGKSAADHSTKTMTKKPTTHGGASKTSSKSKTATVSASGTTTTTTQTKTATKTSHNGTSSSKTSTKSATKTTTNTKNTSTTPTTQMNPIAAKISAKHNLNAKITGMLPKGANGQPISLNDASKGFKNQGQFIAALHASRRLDCGAVSCFGQLKADMMSGKSLGQSIQDVKHTSSTTASSEATRAQREAEHDLAEHDEHHDSHHREDSEHHDRDSHKDFGHGKKFVKQIERNQQLNAKVTALLPAGTTLKKAAKGFSSETQFLAALHASKDLGIPFAQLKSEMTGHDHDSLTQAIRELKPAADARTAAKTALQEARTDIRTTSTQPVHTDH
jgi:hypothetical protein